MRVLRENVRSEWNPQPSSDAPPLYRSEGENSSYDETGLQVPAPSVCRLKGPCESEQVGIRAERVFKTEWTMNTHTHTIRDAWLGKWQKYLLSPRTPLLPLMAADSTKTRAQRITMSFIGHRGGPLPACHSPLLSSYKPLP